jgi:hypothetical protein
LPAETPLVLFKVVLLDGIILAGGHQLEKTKGFKIINAVIPIPFLMIIFVFIFLTATGHSDIAMVILIAYLFIGILSSIVLMEFLRRNERKEGRRIRNVSMAGKEEFMKYLRAKNRRILEKKEGLNDIEALQRIIDFNRRKGFEQLDEIDRVFMKVMMPASIFGFCFGIIILIFGEWSLGVILVGVSVWAFIILLELRSLNRYRDLNIRFIEEELALMQKEERLAILQGSS